MLRPDRGLALVFAVSGAIQASWVSRLPAVRERLHLDVDDLGLALSALGVGTLAGMLLTGRLTTHLGSRRVVLIAATGAAVTLVGLAAAPTFLTFAALSFAFGMAAGAWDVGVNIQGSAVAQLVGGHVMARFHGFWSVGAVVGAGSGVAATRADVPVGVQFVAVAGVSLALTALGAHGPPGKTSRVERRPGGSTRRVKVLGLLIFTGAFIEGAAGDWLAVFLVDEHDLTHAEAATAYAAFVTAMTAGRFGTARLYRYMSPDHLVRTGVLVAWVGVIATVLAPIEAVAYAGAVMWGLGICFVFPAVIAAGGAEPGASQVVGQLTTIGYGAGFIGPLALGAIAERIQLGTSLLYLSAPAAAIVWLASAVRPPPEPDLKG